MTPSLATALRLRLCSWCFEWIPTLCLVFACFVSAWGLGGTRPEVIGTTFSALSLAALVLAAGMLCGHTGVERVPAWWLWSALMTAYVYASARFVSPAPWLGFQEAAYGTALTVAFAVALVSVRRSALRVFWVLSAVVLIVFQIGAALYQYKTQSYWLPLELKLPVYGGRSSGTFGSPNSLGSLLAMGWLVGAVFLAGRLWRRAWGWQTYGLGVWVLLNTVGLGLTLSRGALLGLALALVILPWCLPMRLLWRLVFYVALASVVGLVRILLSSNFEVYQKREVLSVTEGIDPSRLAMWKAAWQNFLSHPFLGSGSASYNVAFESYRPKGFLHDPIWAHNEYLNLASDYGLVGCLLVLGPLSVLVFKTIVTYRNLTWDNPWKSHLLAILLVWVAWGVHAAFDFNLHIPLLGYAWMLSLAVAAHYSTSFGPLLPRALAALLLVSAAWVLWTAKPWYRSQVHVLGVSKALHGNTYAIEQNTLPLEVYEDWRMRTEQAIRAWPGNPEAWSQLAQLAYYQYRVSADPLFAQDAQKAGAMATYIAPAYWRYWVYYGLGLAACKEWDRAGVAFQAALQLAPAQPDAWYYYAVFLNNHTPRSDKVLQALERCLQLDPRYHPAASLKDRLMQP